VQLEFTPIYVTRISRPYSDRVPLRLPFGVHNRPKATLDALLANDTAEIEAERDLVRRRHVQRMGDRLHRGRCADAAA
jgi:hypothetical protein